jgi:phage FluMu protein Com
MDGGKYIQPRASRLSSNAEPAKKLLKRTMSCAICNKKWLVVYPEGCPEVKCPFCGYKNDIREFQSCE